MPGAGPRDGAGRVVGMWDGGRRPHHADAPGPGLRGRRGENEPAQASLAGATAERAWDHHESQRATGAHCDRHEGETLARPGAYPEGVRDDCAAEREATGPSARPS